MASQSKTDRPAPIFVSPAETGRILNRGLTHIGGLINSGKLRSVKSGRRRLVDYSSVVEHAESLLADAAKAEAA